MNDNLTVATGRLTDLVYAATLGESSWEAFLHQLSGLLPNGRAVLFFHDARTGTGNLALNSGLQEDHVHEYEKHYSKVNPWMAGATTRPVGRAVVSDAMLPRRELLKTEYYNDFLRLEGLTVGVGVTLCREQGCNFLLSLVGADTEEAQAVAVADCLQALVPHLRRAFDYYRRHRKEPCSALFGDDSLCLGIVNLGHDGKVVAANAAGARMLEAGDGLRIDHAGRLFSGNAEMMEHVRTVLGGWWKSRLSLPPKAFLAARKGSPLPLQVTVIAPTASEEEAFFRGPECILLVEDPDYQPLTGIENFAALYRLTAAEKRLVAGLAEGLELAEIAARAGISVGTARVQLKEVFAKSGLHRQAEVIRQVYKLTSRAAV